MPDNGRVSVARQAKLWQWGAVVYVVLAAIFFAFMPLYQRPDGASVSAFGLLSWAVFLPLLVPLGLVLVPVLVRVHRVRIAWICVAVLAVVCIGLAFNWGIVFIAAPLISAVGAYLTGRAPVEDEVIEDAPWQVPKA